MSNQESWWGTTTWQDVKHLANGGIWTHDQGVSFGVQAGKKCHFRNSSGIEAKMQLSTEIFWHIHKETSVSDNYKPDDLLYFFAISSHIPAYVLNRYLLHVCVFYNTIDNKDNMSSFAYAIFTAFQYNHKHHILHSVKLIPTFYHAGSFKGNSSHQIVEQHLGFRPKLWSAEGCGQRLHHAVCVPDARKCTFHSICRVPANPWPS